MKIIVLKNKNLAAKIAPEYGSNLISFKIGKTELMYTNLSLLKKHDFTGCFNLWPFPNRVRNREYIFEKKKYFLKEVWVPRGNYPLIHGLVQDQVWQFQQLSQTKAKTWLKITPDFKYFKSWPFPSRLTLTYSLLKSGIKINYQVDNLGDKTLGFGFALHPYFYKALSFSVPAKFVMVADKELLPSGKLLPADFTEPLDHVFTGITGPAEIKFKKHKIIMKTSPDFTHCVIYTGEKPKSICVEPQTCSTDAFNLDNLGFAKEAHLIRVKAGEKVMGWVEYQTIDL